MTFSQNFDAFHERAMAATGLDDFGPADYQAPLRLLLGDLDEYGHFSSAGVEMMAADIIGKLATRLITEAGFKAFPEFAEGPVERPIIVAGMARTGSTALLRLLSADPANQGLELWLGCLPMPRPPRTTWEDNPAYRQIVDQFEQLYALNPAIRRIHPMIADRPDECRFALDQSFWAPSLATTATTPNYTRWLLSCDASFAYARYRRVLGLVAGGDSRRWVLKDPSHNFGIDALIRVFPDACFVQTHREPGVSLASVASLIFELRKLREPALAPEQNGREQLESWPRALEKAEALRRALPVDPYFDLHFREIAENPVDAMVRLYTHFGLPVSGEAREAWGQVAGDRERGGHGRHDYDAGQSGFSLDDVRRITPGYCERLDGIEAMLGYGT